jgi:O-antigen/teichoic acid export membrane protein
VAPPPEYDSLSETAPKAEVLERDALAPRSSMKISSRIQRAALWTGINSFLMRFAQFGVGVAVARLVAPRDFGVFAVALTVHAVIMNFSELGVSAALIRAKDEDVDRMAPTVFTIALLSSAALTALMYAAADPLASALGAPDAATAIRVLSFTVLLGGLTAVPYALLVRGFRQDKRFAADACNFAVSTAAVIGMALAGMGASGLALSKLAGQATSWIVLIILISPRFRPGWSLSQARSILGFSVPLAGASAVAFALANADYAVVGRLLGPLALGLYMLAYNIAGWPVSIFGMLVNEVVLPALAHVREDLASLPHRLALVFGLSSAAVLPVSALCLVLANPLVVSVYGSRWAAAAQVLAVLGMFGASRVLLTVLTSFLVVLGHSRAVLGLQTVWIISLVPALIVGVRAHSIVGAGVAQQVVALFVVLPLALTLVRRAGGGAVFGLVRMTFVPLGCAVAAAAAAFIVNTATGGSWAGLVVGGLSGGLVYLALVGRWAMRRLSAVRASWDDYRNVVQA